MNFAEELEQYLKAKALGENSAAIAHLDQAIRLCPHPLCLDTLVLHRSKLVTVLRPGIKGWFARFVQTG